MRDFPAGRVLCFCISLALFTNAVKASETKRSPIATFHQPTSTSTDSIPAKLVKGKVTAQENGQPMAGVTVTNVKTKKTVQTDADGNFSLYVKEGETVRFSFVGRTGNTIVYRSGLPLNVVMEPSDMGLDSVVVTGYQRINKREFTGAKVGLKADDIKIDGTTDVSRMLEGKAAGVTIQNVSSTFGTAPKVNIRGAASINGDNKPLWVIDGVVLEDVVSVTNDQLTSGDPATLLGSSVAGLNMNDIERIDILKDAGATALYGARAMNGVIVITTKKGKVGKPVINYTGNFSTQLKPTYGSYNIMNSADQMALYKELLDKGMLNSTIADRPNTGVFGKMYDEIDRYDRTNRGFGVENTPAGRAAFLQRYVSINTDWFDILFKNSFIQEHNISISGGSDKSRTYFSTGFYNDNGWTIADKVNRYTLNFKNTYNLSDKVTTVFSAVGSYRQQRVPGTVKRDKNAVTGEYDRDFDINPFSYALNSSRTLAAYQQDGTLEYYRANYAPFNIINELRNNFIDLNVLDIRLQGELNYKINKNLSYEFVGALRQVKSTTEQQVLENSNMAMAYRAANTSTIRDNNKFLYRDPDFPDEQPIVVLPYGGFYNRVEDQLTNYDFRNSLNFSKAFGENHSLNVLAGQQVKFANRQNANNIGAGYQYDNGGVASTDYKFLKQMLEGNFPYYGMTKKFDRFAAFYATANYSFMRKYNFTATTRYDGSNQLGTSAAARWLPTWSVSGSWNIESEKFMKELDFLNYLTLRASYGLTGSMGPATNSNLVARSRQANRPYTAEKESVIGIESLTNKGLTWEKLYTANFGLDGGLFKNRLSFSLDIYTRKSFDLISTIKTSGVGGQKYKEGNDANLRSQGAELMLGGTVLDGKDFKWRTNLSVGFNKNRITSAGDPADINALVRPEGGNKTGYPVNSLFSLAYKGMNYKTGVPTFVNDEGVISGDVYLQSPNTDYLVYEGSINPTLTAGFSNTIFYRSFSLNLLISCQAGNKIRLYNAFKSKYSDLDATSNEFYDRWALPGDQAKTDVPSIVNVFIQNQLGDANPFSNYNFSTQRVANGAFVRLKTLSLSYMLPAHVIEKTKLNNMSITAQSINPWLIYADAKLKGQDPEFFNAGGVAQPIQKQFTLSLKVGI